MLQFTPILLLVPKIAHFGHFGLKNPTMAPMVTVLLYPAERYGHKKTHDPGPPFNKCCASFQ